MAGLNLLITGRPGVGKTTLVMRVVERLRGSLRLAGFTTAEVRDPSGARVGFQILTVEGKQAELAHVGFRSPVQVGRYGVNLEAFERLALPELARRDVDLIVIDEIGKMECLSERLVAAMRVLLCSDFPVVATVGARGTGFISEIKRWPDCELWEVTHANRNDLSARILAWLAKST